jgi:hypothetical protein
MTKTRTADYLLYLDYDGVLHDGEVYVRPRGGPYIATPGRTLFEWVPILEDLLALHPHVAIVLSTSWVRVFSFERAKQRLSPALQTRVIGATFHNRWMRKSEFAELFRGQQIVEDAGRRRPKHWFAIDDEHEGWPTEYADKLVRTSSHLGLSDPTVQQEVRARLAQWKSPK